VTDKRKTYKREVAIIVGSAYAVAWGYGLWAHVHAPEANHDGIVSMLNGAAPWVAALVGGAFGLDCWAKQIRGIS